MQGAAVNSLLMIFTGKSRRRRDARPSLRAKAEEVTFLWARRDAKTYER